MRFQLIDRIDSWVPQQRIAARKLAAAVEDYWWIDHIGRLRMPPELLLESVCQAATWLIMLGTGFGKRAVLLSADEVVCAGEVIPGDVLMVTVTIGSMNDDAAIVDGTVDVDGRQVLRATGIMCALRDTETLEAIQDVQRTAGQLLRLGSPR